MTSEFSQHLARPATERTTSQTPAAAVAIQPKSLSLQDVSKKFGAVTALQPTSLDVEPGELVALLGPSGCGKTTTLRLIAGFEFSDTGRVMIGGADVSRLPPNKRSLGMVFQNYSLFPHMTVAENIAYGLRMAGVAKAERERSAARMLDMIRLPQHGQRQISQLSGGQQQRVALARAIVTNPSVLLLDEPLGALDKNLREGMQFEIRQLQQRLGITSVMVTHDQEEAMTMSDRIVVMSEGRILQCGAPGEVYERPRTRFVAEFLGTANVLKCRITSTSQTGVTVQLDGLQQGAGFSVGTRHDIRAHRGVTLEIALRPEKIMLNASGERLVHLDGVVKAQVFRGAQRLYRVELPGASTLVHVSEQASPGSTALQAGEQVTLSFDPHDAVILEDDDIEDGRAAA